jgi:hypothetical protein
MIIGKHLSCCEPPEYEYYYHSRTRPSIHSFVRSFIESYVVILYIDDFKKNRTPVNYVIHDATSNGSLLNKLCLIFVCIEAPTVTLAPRSEYIQFLSSR